MKGAKMNLSLLQSMNKRQFDRTMKLEGQTVYNVNKNTEEKVFFAKTRNSKSSQDKLSIFYSADCSIKKGDIIKYNNFYHVVINENYYENDVWRNSILVRCNSVWNLHGKTVPLVASDLGSSSPSNGNFLSTVGGTFNLYTSDIQLLHDKINIGDSFFDFGGVYKLVNKFFIDGLAYLYFQRGILSLTEPTINRIGNEIGFDIARGSKQLKYYVGYNTGLASQEVFYVPGAKINYSVDNENVATIDENGLLTFKSTGDVTVYLSCTVALENGGEYKVYNISREDKYTIAETDIDGGGDDSGDNGEGGDDNPSNPSGVTWSVAQDLIDYSYVKSSYFNTFTIKPSKETNAVVTWKLLLDGEEYTDPDIVDYMEIITDGYTYKYKVISQTLVNYKISIQAVINGVPTLVSKESLVAI